VAGAPGLPSPAVPVLVCVPTYLEIDNIEELLRRLRAAVPDADVLVIDDNSPDGTAERAEALAAELGGIEVLRRPSKLGLGSAYRAGFAIGIERGYDLLVQMDADLSHDPAALPDLLAAAQEGADLVIGSRYVPGGSIPHWPWLRRALSRYGNLYTGIAIGLSVKDATSGYRVFRADALREIEFDTTKANGYLFQIELAYRIWLRGGRIVERPIVFTDRVRGNSKMNWRIALEELLYVTWWGVRDRIKPHWRGARRRPGVPFGGRRAAA
jgi:dolichol-phosphate mannosyltransferase